MFFSVLYWIQTLTKLYFFDLQSSIHYIAINDLEFFFFKLSSSKKKQCMYRFMKTHLMFETYLIQNLNICIQINSIMFFFFGISKIAVGSKL